VVAGIQVVVAGIPAAGADILVEGGIPEEVGAEDIRGAEGNQAASDKGAVSKKTDRLQLMTLSSSVRC
jgi:hypothetical protein